MNPLKKLAGQTVVYGIPSILLRVLGYLLTPLYTRVLHTDEYGTYVYLYSVVALMIVVLTYGMETAFFRFFSRHPSPSTVFRTAFISILTTSGIFALVTFFYAAPVSRLIGLVDHADYVRYFALILAFDAVSAIPFAYLRANNQPRRFAIYRMINILVNISFNLLFLLLFPLLATSFSESTSWLSSFRDGGNLVKYIFLSNLIASVVTLLLSVPTIRSAKGRFDFNLWIQMLRYALPLLIAGLAGIINETFDRVLLKHLLPADIADSQIGIYGACYKISIFITLFIQAFRYAAEPFFFSHAAQADSKVLYSKMLTYFVLAVSILFLITLLYLDVIILFVGEDFRSGRDAIPVLMVANVFLGVFFNLSIWYKLTNQTVYGAYLALIGAGVTVILNLWTIPDYGYMGSAWATLACYFMMMVLSYWWGQKHYPVRYNLRKVALYFGSTLFIYMIYRLFDHTGFGMKMIIATLLLGLYLSVVGFIEFPVIRSVLKRR